MFLRLCTVTAHKALGHFVLVDWEPTLKPTPQDRQPAGSQGASSDPKEPLVFGVTAPSQLYYSSHDDD